MGKKSSINRLAFFIAKRYLFSKKSHSVINLISIVSLISIGVPAAAMVILLSVSNGFNSFVKSLNSNFDPQINISLSEGSFFDASRLDSLIYSIENITHSTKYFEAEALFVLNDKQHFGKIRGIDSTYKYVFPIESSIIDGQYNNKEAIIGAGIAYSLMMSLGVDNIINIYAPSNKGSNFLGINNSFNHNSIQVSSVYALDVFTDSKYALIPLSFSQNLFWKPNMISSIGIKVEDSLKIESTKRELRAVLGEDFRVRDSFEIRETEYKIASNEKKIIFMILIFVTIIASLTLIGSLVILTIEKQQQTTTLYYLGATKELIKKIFVYQGFIISLGGTIIGVVFSVIFCIAQQTYGFIKIQSNMALIDSYPVILYWTDVLIVSISIFLIGYIITVITINATINSKN